MTDGTRRVVCGKCRPVTKVSTAATNSLPGGTVEHRRIVADAQDHVPGIAPALPVDRRK